MASGWTRVFWTSRGRESLLLLLLATGFAASQHAGSVEPASSPPASGSAGQALPATPGTAPSHGALQYEWEVDQSYHCHFQLEATIGDEKPLISGSVFYHPTDSDPGQFGGKAVEGEGTGTAFVVAPEGVLVTCAHVVRGATEIEVRLGGKTYAAKAIAFDAGRDLALLKVEASGLPCLTLGDSSKVELAQDVRAVGFPLTDVLGDSIKITRGTISGIIQRKDGSMLQIDASVNPGNSGGPLVDAQGRVVGIASALLDGQSVDRVGFAIPVNEASDLLKENGTPVPPASENADLDGPELARRVTPSIALVKVRIGPGGVGIAAQRVVRYFVVCSTGRGGELSWHMPKLPETEGGNLVVDTRGQVTKSTDGSWSPFFLGPLSQIGIEPLSSDGRNSWRFTRTVLLFKQEGSSDSSDYPESRSRFGLPRYRPSAERAIVCT